MLKIGSLEICWGLIKKDGFNSWQLLVPGIGKKYDAESAKKWANGYMDHSQPGATQKRPLTNGLSNSDCGSMNEGASPKRKWLVNNKHGIIMNWG